MSDKLDLIWYKNPTRPTTEKQHPTSLKQSPDIRRHQPPKTSTSQPKKSEGPQRIR